MNPNGRTNLPDCDHGQKYKNDEGICVICAAERAEALNELREER